MPLRLALSFSLAVALLSPALQAEDSNTPPTPITVHFFHSSQSLNPEIPAAIDDLLSEHERLTSEEVVIVALDKAQSEEHSAQEWLPEMMRTRAVGARSAGRGVMVILDSFRRQAKVGAAFGMVERLSPATLSALGDEIARPYLKQDALGEAALAVTIALLRELDSPLIESGRWQAAVALVPRGNEAAVVPDPENRLSTSFTWGVVVSAALIFLVTAGMQLGAEAHFSADGWTRYRPWKLLSHQRAGRLRAETPGDAPTLRGAETGGTYGRW